MVNNHFCVISYVIIHNIQRKAVTANVICLPTISNSNKVLSYVMLSYLIFFYILHNCKRVEDERGK